MKTLPAWHYNEFRHVGADYADPQHAEAFDATFFRLRGDPTADNEQLLDELGVQAGQTFIDLGCGTGDLAIQAALRRCCNLCGGCLGSHVGRRPAKG